MKGVVGFLFFMLFLAGFALVLLQGRQQAERNLGQGAARWVGTEWRPAPATNDGVSIRFAADGTVSGFAGCNEFSGALERSEQSTTFGPLGTTRRACADDAMARERWFLGALESTSTIDWDNDDLLLSDAAGELLLRLEPAPSQ